MMKVGPRTVLPVISAMLLLILLTVTGCTTCTTQETPTPKLVIEKLVDCDGDGVALVEDIGSYGDTPHWFITVTNTSDSPVNDIIVTDTNGMSWGTFDLDIGKSWSTDYIGDPIYETTTNTAIAQGRDVFDEKYVGPVSASATGVVEPLKIIIYTDFECGACGKLHSEVEPELRERYVATGMAEIEIRLLGAMSDYSMRAAQAALCAGDQGYFLEYTDALFNAWRVEEDYTVFSVEALTDLAASLGLDEAAFIDCLDTEAKRAELEENMNMAQLDGVQTLPAFLIGTSKIEGCKSLDTYIQAIEDALAAQDQ